MKRGAILTHDEAGPGLFQGAGERAGQGRARALGGQGLVDARRGVGPGGEWEEESGESFFKK